MGALTPSQVRTIKATVPVLAEHGNTITTRFYHDLLEAQALAGALYAYAANIDDLGKLSPAVELICHKHASLFIRPDQYDVVGKHLLETMSTVLGEAATPEILEAWGAAYWQLANLMIGKEDEMYKQTAYWPDWKDFSIAKKEKESDEITSFYLEPVDKEFKLPMYKPGQYISVNVFVEELDGGVWQARQYSLSDAPGKKYLRISVKREPGIEVGEKKHMTHAGYISNLLHDMKNEGDVIKVSHPFGDFFFDKDEVDADAPVVLISAGSNRPITWIQGARNSATRAFKAHFDQCAAANENVHAVYYSSSPSEGEVQGRDYTIQGRVDLDKIDRQHLHADSGKTVYYCCGPTRFMLDVEAKLKSYGVPSERVKMELFGTGGVPRV
ncbi:unnamed protein product [Alternaria burnsii]|nr:unnamed protein product [Alternaria burnsii]